MTCSWIQRTIWVWADNKWYRNLFTALVVVSWFISFESQVNSKSVVPFCPFPFLFSWIFYFNANVYNKKSSEWSFMRQYALFMGLVLSFRWFYLSSSIYMLVIQRCREVLQKKNWIIPISRRKKIQNIDSFIIQLSQNFWARKSSWWHISAMMNARH